MMSWTQLIGGWKESKGIVMLELMENEGKKLAIIESVEVKVYDFDH